MTTHALLTDLSLATLDQHMVRIEGGSFEMGGESISDDAKPVHRVRLNSFALCRYPVTQALWREVMGADPEELYFTGGDRPVEKVHWYDALACCNRLSEASGLEPAYTIDPHKQDPKNRNSFDHLKWSVSLIPDSKGYRLPSEAEWEYAARGGRYARDYDYAGSTDLDEVGWYDDNSYDETQPPGLKLPNALGLYDLSGNVWEWCQDWYGDYLSQAKTHSSGPADGEYRVSRGGSWYYDLGYTRVSRRYSWHPDSRNDYLSLRLARST
ncbi:MAG: formylglycine-generating enzyme family protein [Bacteroidetes bacterium]|nr:MAG: formylglycine-generating enzyme family protein [Bacteroidota bacterium]